MSTYTVGQVVGIIRNGSWGTVAQGKYTVTKVNKVRVELTRVGDGHVRTFSVKTGKEFSICSGAWIVSEGRYDQEVAMQDAVAAREKSVADLKKFAAGLHHRGVGPDDITILRALVDEAEKFAIIA
jgi:hypothetical protein